MPAPRVVVAALAALAPVVAAAGCGGDDAGRTATVGNARAIEVVGDEYSFDPKALVVETGSAGKAAPVELRLRNDGALAHNLKVRDGDEELGGTPTFQGGETRSARVRLAPGRYSMVCTVADHEELGMVGTLEVRR